MIEVTEKWLEGLLAHCKNVRDVQPDITEVTNKEQTEFLVRLAQLKGYISSAEYLLERSKDETKTM